MSTAVGSAFSSAMILGNFYDPTLGGDRPGGQARRPVLQIFDEKDGVAAFVVEQLVYQIPGEQDAEAAGAPALLGAHLDVADGGVRRVGDGGVRQEVQREAGAGVVNVSTSE